MIVQYTIMPLDSIHAAKKTNDSSNTDEYSSVYFGKSLAIMRTPFDSIHTPLALFCERRLLFSRPPFDSLSYRIAMLHIEPYLNNKTT